jgi:hypothetical protein
MANDSKRALGVGKQTGPGVAAASIHYFNFMRGVPNHQPGIEYEIPEYEAYSRWRQREALITTRLDTVTFTLDVDTTDIGYVLQSLGVPTTAGNTHDFIPGINAGAVPSRLITVKWHNGLVTHTMLDAVVSRIRGTFTVPNTWTLEVTVVGLMATVGAAATPTFEPPPDKSPMKPWQTVVTKDGVAVCMVTFTFDLNMGADPFYCSPVEEPDAETEPGLAPSRFLEGPIVGTYSISYEYLADAGSSYEAMRKNIREGWVIQSTDPAGQAAGTLAYLPTVRIEIPNVQGTGGNLDESRPNTLQSISGAILYNSALGAGMKFRLINGATY